MSNSNQNGNEIVNFEVIKEDLSKLGLDIKAFSSDQLDKMKHFTVKQWNAKKKALIKNLDNISSSNVAGEQKRPFLYPRSSYIHTPSGSPASSKRSL